MKLQNSLNKLVESTQKVTRPVSQKPENTSNNMDSHSVSGGNSRK
jgi:hypothetical protein